MTTVIARRDLVASLSLATLWFIGAWSDLLPFLYISDAYPIGALPCWNDFAAVMLNVALFGTVFAVAGSLARRGPQWVKTAAGWGLLASLLVPANAVRLHFQTWPEVWFEALGPTTGAIVFGVVGLLAVAAAVRWHAQVVRGVLLALAILFPLVLMTTAQGLWAILQAGGRMQCGSVVSAPQPIPGPAARRVLWIVYDELDFATPFEARPDDLQLPAFDALVSEALSATTAASPGDRTERSMSSALSGVRISDAVLVGRNQLTIEVGEPASRRTWTSADTLLPRVRALGFNTGIAGFFLPYCSLVGDSLTSCTWEPCVTCGRLTGVFGTSLTSSMRYQVAELFPRYGTRRHLGSFQGIQRAALALAGDASIGFALLHLNVPHAPTIWDRDRDTFSVWPIRGDGYVHNLALADRSLAEIRAAIAAAGLDDETTIVVFGDHGRRRQPGNLPPLDSRVPFIVRLAGESRAVRYESPFDVVRVHDLTLRLLAGEVTTTDELVRWMEAPD